MFILLPNVLYCIHFKGQVHVFAGQVQICKSLVLQGKCNIEIFLSSGCLSTQSGECDVHPGEA